jgi:hypothetical protein
MTPIDDVGGSLDRKTFNGIWWSVELPKWWSGVGNEQCATFQADPPLGALQISAARRDAGLVTDDDIKELAAEQISRGQKLWRAECGPFSGFCTEHSNAGSFWKEWWLRSGDLLVYVTYNVMGGKELLEKQDVESMLASLKPISF